MDRSRVSPRLCWLLTAALTLSGVALRSVCMLTRFDSSVGYFNEGILPTLSDILYYLAVIAAITCAALIPKGTLPTELNTRLRRPVAMLWGISLAAFTLGVLLVCYKDRTNTFLTVPMVMGILASLYFFATGNRSGLYSDGLCALGFLPVFWCVASAWETYTDQFTAMNSPIKISLQMVRPRRMNEHILQIAASVPDHHHPFLRRKHPLILRQHKYMNPCALRRRPLYQIPVP